ncbi:MAG: hypothetical protein ACLQKA_22195, partial [Bryobacteraceae bacterium]
MGLPGAGKRGTALSLAFVLLLCGAAAIAQAPPVVVSSNQTLNPALAGATHHMAVNSLGDVFYKDTGTYSIYELVPGNSTPILLLTGTNSPSYMVDSLKGVAIDPNTNNLYVTNDYTSSNNVIVIPFLSGSYPTNERVTGLSICPAYPAPLTGDCGAYGGNGGAATGYFMQPEDFGFDGSGNLYALVNRDNVDSGESYARIVMIPADLIETQYDSNNSGASSVVVADKLPFGRNGTYGGTFAVDSTGNVYYANGTNVYYFAAGTTVAAGTPPPASSILNIDVTAPVGVGVDAFGNLIVTDQSVTTNNVTTGDNRLIEIPNVNGSLDTTQQYTLAYLYSANGVSVDQLGNIYYGGYNANILPPGGTTDGATTIEELTLWNANLGSLAVGTPNAALTLNFTFNAAASVTPASISALPAGGPFALAAGGSGACAAGTAQAQGSSCSVAVTYTPSAAGTQSGAVLLADST